MPTLDQIRNAGEAQLERQLAALDSDHRALLRDALKRYGRVQDIPNEIWERIRQETEERTVAALLLLMIAADDWTAEQLERQGATAAGAGADTVAGYSLDAARRAQAFAAATTDTLRDRLARKVEDMRTVGPGAVGDLTDNGIDQALDEVLTKARREGIAIDATTASLSRGQMGARDRTAGDDGATTVDGQTVSYEMVWRTERDDRVCPRCSPLEGKREEVWGQVFPDGPGVQAHPNCRCWLEPQVVVEAEQLAA